MLLFKDSCLPLAKPGDSKKKKKSMKHICKGFQASWWMGVT